MTWDATVPVATESPSQFPAQAHTNWTLLEDNIDADHVFGTTAAAANLGYHNLTHWVTQAGTVGDGTPAPISGTGQLYTKSVSVISNTSTLVTEMPCYMRGTSGSAAQEYVLGAIPIRAVVVFFYNTSGSSITIYQSHNVSSVTRSTTGIFAVNFTVAMPNASYGTLITCSESWDSASLNGTLSFNANPYDATYTNTTSKAYIKFYKTSSTLTRQDPRQVTAIFLGA